MFSRGVSMKLSFWTRSAVLLVLVALASSCGMGAPPVPSPITTPIANAVPSATPSVEAFPTLTYTPSLTPTSVPSPLPTSAPPPAPSAAPAVTPASQASEAQTSPLYPTRQQIEDPSQDVSVQLYSYKIVNTYPHDREAFTQGLVIVDGQLYEGTGRRGASTLRQVDLVSGQVQKLRALPEQYFGEGIALVEDRVFQLTWHANVGFIYDRESFELLDSFQYPSEGWGLTYDGQHLIMSDGTPTLYFLDPETQLETGQVQVTYLGQPVRSLNELEYVQGEVLANVWKTNAVLRIDPKTGEVTGVIDLSGLLSPKDLTQPVDVLNGIAYDVENDRLFVTGKLWPRLFEIELVAQD